MLTDAGTTLVEIHNQLLLLLGLLQLHLSNFTLLNHDKLLFLGLELSLLTVLSHCFADSVVWTA